MMFGSVLEHFANLRYVKDAKLVFEPECPISGYQSCEASILVQWTKNDVWECSEQFANSRHVKDEKSCFGPECSKRWKTHVSGLNALFRGYQSCEGSILVHWTQNDVWECFGAFRQPRHVIDEKLMFRAWMHYFGVPKSWNIHSSPMDQKWCLGVFRSNSLTLGTSKVKKSCFGPECSISGVPKLWSIHSSPLDPKWFLRVFQMVSLTIGTSKMKNSCFGPKCTISRVPKLWSIHSSPLDPKWCLRVFQMISLTFNM
jgi:hypothetical protein